MRSSRKSLWFRRGDPDRHSFAFFVVGTIVVIAVVFFLGFQLGRYAERGAQKETVGKISPQVRIGENSVSGPGSAEIRREMSAFSEEASKIPPVSPQPAIPPTARDDLKKTESEATFRDSLSRKDPSPEPMAKKKAVAPVPSAHGTGTFLLQAGALKALGAADALRRKLDRGGYRTKVIRASTPKHGDVYRVRVGPFGSREEAMKAMKSIRTELKIDVILLKG